MLADPRSEALVSNFAAQWLHLRNLDDVKAEPSIYPEFDQDLVDAFRQETALFIASTIEENRSVLDLLGADYTYLNERLARHYGIPGVYGSRFRRVTLPDLEQRGGLLGHASLLSLTSYPHRTSPVLRGRWLLEAIFGAPPPGPPPDVPPLPERGESDAPASMRERLELHRRNPACASCHRAIDPPGFMLEHYDAIGRWRSVTAAGHPVDAAGTLGERGDGGRPRRTAEPVARCAGAIREHAHRTASGLRTRTRATVLRPADGARHRPQRGRGWTSLVVGHTRGRREPGVPDAAGGRVTGDED